MGKMWCWNMTKLQLQEIGEAIVDLIDREELDAIVKKHRAKNLISGKTTIGLRLTDLRGTMPRIQVEAETGIGQATIHTHEHDESSPKLTHLIKYAEFYGLTLSELLEGVVE